MKVISGPRKSGEMVISLVCTAIKMKRAEVTADGVHREVVANLDYLNLHEKILDIGPLKLKAGGFGTVHNAKLKKDDGTVIDRSL